MQSALLCAFPGNPRSVCRQAVRCQSSDGSEVSETEGALAAQVTRLVGGASEPKPDCSPSSVSPRIPRLEWGSLPRARRESVCAGRVPDPWPTAAQDEEAAHRCAPPGASRPWRERQHRKVGRRTRLEVRRPGEWSWSYSVAPRLTRVPVALTYPISSEHTQRPLQLQYLLLPALPIDSCTANPKFQFRQRDPPQGGSRRLRSVRPPPPPPDAQPGSSVQGRGGGACSAFCLENQLAPQCRVCWRKHVQLTSELQPPHLLRLFSNANQTDC